MKIHVWCGGVYEQRGGIEAEQNALTAAAFGNRLVDLAESLQRMPERGRRVKGWPDVRVVVLSPYLIFYRFNSVANEAEVLRFWHGARDLQTLKLQR